MQNWEDVPMVEVASPAPLRLPRSATKGIGPTRYTVHTGKGPNHRCDDCLELFAEYHADGRAGSPPPLARMATWNRTQAGTTKILCNEHKHLRQELEATR